MEAQRPGQKGPEGAYEVRPRESDRDREREWGKTKRKGDRAKVRGTEKKKRGGQTVTGVQRGGEREVRQGTP
jgi:hypothetical protein